MKTTGRRIAEAIDPMPHYALPSLQHHNRNIIKHLLLPNKSAQVFNCHLADFFNR
jgi:hypothetical protein